MIDGGGDVVLNHANLAMCELRRKRSCRKFTAIFCASAEMIDVGGGVESVLGIFSFGFYLRDHCDFGNWNDCVWKC